MNPLFRRIRMKLLDENKTYRYLKYAIGEIVLIITGILIAVQISNWNEDRKAQAEFDAYVVQLKTDVGKALDNADRAARISENRVASGLMIIDFLESEVHSVEETEAFDRALTNLGKQSVPQIDIGLLGQLLDGDMGIINRDRNLSQLALELESSLEGTLRVINRVLVLDEYLNATFSKYRTMTGSYVPELKPRYNLDELKSSSEFIYATENCIHNSAGIMGFSESIAERLESFLAVLEEYE